jgi:hypothetical protein
MSEHHHGKRLLELVEISHHVHQYEVILDAPLLDEGAWVYSKGFPIYSIRSKI